MARLGFGQLLLCPEAVTVVPYLVIIITWQLCVPTRPKCLGNLSHCSFLSP